MPRRAYGIVRLSLGYWENRADGTLGGGLAGKLLETTERVNSSPEAPVSRSILTV